MTFERLLQYWQKAASDLGIKLIAPFTLLLSSGNQVEAIFLLPQFGSERGMLVFGSYDNVAPYRDEIIKAGYGFTILDEPLANEEYRKEDYIGLLKDWGWSGDAKSRPNWL